MAVKLSRSGMLTPVVIMVLAIFSILAIAYLVTGTTDYSQSALTIYNLKAVHLAQAALEEAQAAVYDQINRPPRTPKENPPPWREGLFAKIEAAVKSEPDGTGTITGVEGDPDWVNLLSRGLVDQSKTLAIDLGGDAELLECKVKFYGFRKLPYPGSMKIYDKDTYYQSKIMDGENVEAATLVPNDYIGYYTIRATARSRGQVRSLAATHDLKLINVSPIAREFALYQALEVKDTSHQENDLNRGGAVHVFPRGWGRVYMRGPYTVNVEGFPDGTGGSGPVDPTDSTRVASNAFYPHPNGNADSLQSWVGWDLIPNPRAGVLKNEFLAFDGPPQTRPKEVKTSIGHTGLGILTNLPLVSLVGSGFTRLGVDPALYIRNNSLWYTGCASVTDNPQKDFSLVGNPRAKKPGGGAEPQFSMYRGKLFRIDGKNPADEQPYWPSDGNMGDDPKLDGSFPYDPPQDKKAERWVVAPEANLQAKFKVVKFNHAGINWSDLLRLKNPFNFSYNVEVYQESALHVYGLHWEDKRGPGFWEGLLDAAVSVMAGGLWFNPVGMAFNLFNPQAWITGSIPVGPEAASGQGGAAAKYSMPVNYKSYSRAATRYYSKAGRIKSILDSRDGIAEARLVLDGVIWSKEFKLESGFQYVGKGVFGGEPLLDPKQGEGVLTGPIIPYPNRAEEMDQDGFYRSRTNRSVNTPNYITVVYEGAGGNATRGEQMLQVKLRSGPERDIAKNPAVDGTLYSTQGIKPEKGTVIIDGNLICGVLNKQKIPDSAKVIVNYDFPILRKTKAETAQQTIDAYYKGNWHQLAVSPRVAGYYEK